MSNKMCKVVYLLNEEGRKKSLLGGGDGKELQSVEVPITKELLDLETVKVDKNGNVNLDLSNSLKMNIKITTSNYNSINWEGKKYYCPLRQYDDRKVYFSDIKTAEELVVWEKDRLLKLKQLEEDIQKDYEKREEEYNQAYQKHTEEENRIKEIEKARIQEKKEKQEAEKRAEKEDDINWINTKGSDYLKQCLELGYNCKRKYIEERVEKEFFGFELDFDDKAYWKERVSPSEDALDEVSKWLDKGFKAEIVWLTNSVYGSEYDFDNDFEPCEAIVIKFKDYWLVKPM